MINVSDWRVFGGTVELENTSMKVDHVDLEVVLNDTTSRNPRNPTEVMPIFITDLQFQPGFQKTGWNPNTKEFLDRIEFSVNEDRNYGSTWTHAIPPKTYTPQDLGYERLFNFMGRGHESIVFPNDLPEPEFWSPKLTSNPVEILTTGIDWTLIAKDDFDLVRISTENGGPVDPDDHLYKDLIEKYEEDNPNSIKELINHPLSNRYSREFYFKNGKEGDVMEFKASITTARINGRVVNKKPEREITLGGRTYKIYGNKFQLIPRGSVRFRIEFYTLEDVDYRLPNRAGDGYDWHTEKILKNSGVGYYGYTTFKQYTWGKERL